MTSRIKQFAPVLTFLLIVGIATVVTNHVADAATLGAADYHSSLTTGIVSSDTSLTVVSTTTGTENLIQGATYGLKIGGKEYALGTLGAGKTFTGLTRGVSLLNGTTTGGTAQSWGRGTSVEITDAPVLLEIINKIAGRQWFDNALRYSGVTTGTLGANGNNIASVDYVNSVAFGAVPAANETTSGFVELSTGAEAAAGTSVGGTGARLALGGNLATSTYNTPTRGNVIPVTNASGKTDAQFVATSSIYAYTLPVGRAVASTSAPLSDASGNVTWNGVTTLLNSTAPFTTNGGLASSTFLSITIPARTMGIGNVLHVRLNNFGMYNAPADWLFIEASYGVGATTSLDVFDPGVGSKNLFGTLDFFIQEAGSTNSQRVLITSNLVASSSPQSQMSTSTQAVDSTAAQPLNIIIRTDGGAGNNYLSTWINTTEVLRQ